MIGYRSDIDGAARSGGAALGGLVAVGGVPAVTRPATRAALAWGGLALIVLGLFAVGPESAFPIPWAAPSVVGTELLIAYAPGTFAAKLLSARPAVAIGQISCSPYLWHWPIIVFYRRSVGATLSWHATILLVLASFIAAVASRELVEKAVPGPLPRAAVAAEDRDRAGRADRRRGGVRPVGQCRQGATCRLTSAGSPLTATMPPAPNGDTSIAAVHASPVRARSFAPSAA